MNECYFMNIDSSVATDEVPVNGKFMPADSFNFDQSYRKYWTRFEVQNLDNHENDIQFFLGLSETYILYELVDGKWVKHSIGTFESRKISKAIAGPGKTLLSQALLHFKPNETRTFYGYLDRKSGETQAKRDAKISPRLISAEIWASKVKLSEKIWNFIFGCFAILFLYHIVFYYVTRDSAYLYFCLFVLTISIPYLTLVYDVFMEPKYSASLFFGISGQVAAFYFHFTRKILDLKKIMPKWDRFLRISANVKFMLVFTYIAAHLYTNNIFIILSILGPALIFELVVIVLLVINLFRTRDRLSGVFAAGSVVVWALLLYLIIIGNSDPESSFTPQIYPYKYASSAGSFVLYSLFFAMILSYRARLNEIEKKKAKDQLIEQLQKNKNLQEKVNRELEIKVAERTQTIEEERQKTEGLLLNVLPKSVVMEMKEFGKTEPKFYEKTTVLFGDFVGFTNISAALSPSELVTKLDFFFKNFDAILIKYHIEKIKTIGDAYMCICGVPEPHDDHAYQAIKAAIEMQEFMQSYNQSHPEESPWIMRIGINSGPVVAGVIGDFKFSYDIWGDTVNTAARMEQNSEAGRINVSETTYQIVKDRFNFSERGLISAKNKGQLNMYFVENKIVG